MEGAGNRARFLLETLAAVRKVWPEHLPLTARFGVVEYNSRDGQALVDSIEIGKEMRELGLDLLNVSIGFSALGGRVPWGTQAFLAPLAERFANETGLPVATGWCIDDPQTAERVVADC